MYCVSAVRSDLCIVLVQYDQTNVLQHDQTNAQC